MKKAQWRALVKSLPDLDVDQLHELDDVLHRQIAERAEPAPEPGNEPTPAPTKGRKTYRRQHSAPWIETRIVKGHAYRYQVQWVNWKREVKYLGKA